MRKQYQRKRDKAQNSENRGKWRGCEDRTGERDVSRTVCTEVE